MSRLIHCLTLAALNSALTLEVSAAPTTFTQDFLHNFRNESPVDLSQFERSALPPGKYLLDVVINDRQLDARMVELVAAGETTRPCMNRENMPELAELFPEAHSDCIDLVALLPGVQISVDGPAQRLVIFLPQQIMQRIKRRSLRKSWDQGVDALLANYTISANRNSAGSQLSFATQMGLNTGPWRWRTSLSVVQGGKLSANRIAQLLYGYRHLSDWNGQLVVGNALAGGTVLGTNRIYGVQFHTDTDMDPDKLAGARPKVRGLARTNATIRIFQSGHQLYSRNVPPGDFLIEDLPVLLGNQDLLVRVEESDGRVQEYLQPVSVLPSMRATGESTWSLAIGRSASASDFNILSWQHARGIASEWTFNTEGVLGNRYQALSAGVTRQLGNMGALEADVSVSHYHDPFNDGRGASARVLWAKSLSDTQTDFQLIAARHDSPGYLDMNDAVALSESPRLSRRFRTKDSLQMIVQQRIGARLSVSANATQTTAWDSQDKQQVTALNANWQMSGSSLLSLSYNRTQVFGFPTATFLMLQWQMPLGIRPDNQSFMSIRRQVNDPGGSGYQASLGGAFGEKLQSNYAVTLSHGQEASLDGFLGQNTSKGLATLSFSHYSNGTSLGAQFSGGLALHRDGLTLGTMLGESAALVYTGGVGDVNILGYPNSVSDRKGYALIPSLAPYRENSILLQPGFDPAGNSAEVETLSKEVVPSRGALVRIPFKAQRGIPVLLSIRRDNGQWVPLGARIDLGEGRENWVGPRGMSYVLLPDTSGVAKVVWGDGRCTFAYDVTQSVESIRREVQCNG
ncbi:fimbria/pilus outer membrane usher protein [Burkholderiaceae bacterium DAT-1]|nr:fimbria/pilus outer membrane usher protein [Burkholderiaceae bacterium DAT-1]